MTTSPRPAQRIFTLVSLALFVGSIGFSAVQFMGTVAQENQSVVNEGMSEVSRLATQEQGYEMVLQKEPANETALKGLAETRLQMNNPQGAVEPLEKLVQVNPAQKEYQMLLSQVKQQVNGN